MQKHFTVSFLMAIVFTGCVTSYTTPVFNSRATEHTHIAVLPYQVVYTGRANEKLGPADIEKVREAEALAFQRSMHNELLRESGSGKKDIKIEIQTPERTNRILQDSGINPVFAWKETPERLSRVLGVDALVETRIEKEKFLTDLESFGLQLGGDILDKVLKDIPLDLPPGADPAFYNKTYKILTDCQLLNGKDASLLWKVTADTETDWNFPANDVITGLNRKYAKKFPYREKSYYKR